jgi:hypothetical protein
MKLNEDKSVFVRFTKKRNLLESQYTVGPKLLHPDPSCKYLGVTLASDLNWNKHVEAITLKANRTLHFVMRNCKGMDAQAKSLAYQSLVRPTVEYSSMVWDPHLEYQVQKVEKVQRKAARFVHNRFGISDSVTELLDECQWQPLKNRRKISRLSGLFRACTGESAWGELGVKLKPPTYFGRHDHPFKIQPIQNRTDTGKFSFLSRTIEDWNCLPSAALSPLPNNYLRFKQRIQRLL